jgi:hypothetical protein
MAFKKIEEPKAGTPVNQLWKTVRDCVRAVNAMGNMTISPTGLGKVEISDSNAKIIFNTEECDT